VLLEAFLKDWTNWHPDVLIRVNNLADAYRKVDKMSLAEELYKDVLPCAHEFWEQNTLP
jgi:hypothetical protein